MGKAISLIEYNYLSLLMIIPVAITIGIAIRSGNIIIATTVGIVLSSIFAVSLGLIDLLQIDPILEHKAALILVSGEGLDREIGGIIYSGLENMIQVIVLCLLLFGSIQIMKEGHGDKILLHHLEEIIRDKRTAELSISLMVIFLSSLMGLNAPAILAVGSSFAKPIGEKYGISPYRIANLMDAQSNTLVYSMPWTPALVYTIGFARDTQYPLTTSEITPFVFYSYAILLVMMVSIVIQGRTRDELA